MTSRPYHHGDLPTALLTRAEQALRERGPGHCHCGSWPATSE